MSRISTTACKAGLRTSLCLATVLTPSLLLPSAHAGVQWADWNNANDFLYSIKSMPDFDQVRNSDDPAFIGFPNNGTMFCVPSSSTNALAYVATHGFPEYEPGQDNWSLKSTYNDAGQAILDLSVEMNTNPFTGTSPVTAHTALDQRLNQKFTVTHTWASFNNPAPVETMVEEAINGGLVIPYYYFFNMGTNNHGEPTGVADGGHCVTLVYASADANSKVIGVRDPAQAEADPYAQSDFTTRLWNMTKEFILIDGLAWQLDRLGPSAGQNRYLGGWITIIPKCHYSWEPYSNGYTQYRATELNGNQDDFNREITLATHNEIIDLANGPRQTSWILVKEQTFYKLYAISNHDGSIDPSPIDDLVRAEALAFDRHHNLHVLDSDGLKSYRSDDHRPIGAIPLPSPAPKLVVNDRSDEVVILLPDTGHLAFMPVDYSSTPEMKRLPAEVVLSDTVEMAISPIDGTVFLMDLEATRTWAVTEDRGDLVAELVELGGAEEATAIKVDDSGDLLVANRGEINAFSKEDGTWRPNPENSRHGTPVSSKFEINMSRSNWTDDAIVVPEKRETGEGATDLLDCDADLNWDRAVDVEDLLIVLESWSTEGGSPGDITNDQLVDIEDLLVVVSDWGNCPE